MGKNMPEGNSPQIRSVSEAGRDAFIHYEIAVEQAGSGQISFRTARRVEAAYADWVRISDPEHAEERIAAAHAALARRLAS